MERKKRMFTSIMSFVLMLTMTLGNASTMPTQASNETVTTVSVSASVTSGILKLTKTAQWVDQAVGLAKISFLAESLNGLTAEQIADFTVADTVSDEFSIVSDSQIANCNLNGQTLEIPREAFSETIAGCWTYEFHIRMTAITAAFNDGDVKQLATNVVSGGQTCLKYKLTEQPDQEEVIAFGASPKLPVNTYTVQFYDEDGISILGTLEDVLQGSDIFGMTPKVKTKSVKTGDEAGDGLAASQINYGFSKWVPSEIYTGDLTDVQGDMVFSASYTPKTVKVTYYVLKKGYTVPSELSSYPKSNYTLGVSGNLDRLIEIANDNDAVNENLFTPPTAAEFIDKENGLDLNGAKYTISGDEIIVWYVVKYDKSDGWHVDGIFATPTPIPSPTEIPTDIPSPSPTEVPTEIPSPSPTEVPTEIPSPSPTETIPRVTASPTPFVIEVPTETPPQAPPATETPTPLPTETPTPTPFTIVDIPIEDPPLGDPELPNTGTMSPTMIYILGAAVVLLGIFTTREK